MQHLNVLVRSEAKGDAMWAPEASAGDVALMRIPLSSFSNGSEAVPARRYKRLPQPDGYVFQNRFVGDYLIYGMGQSWVPQQTTQLPKPVYLVEWARGDVHRLEVPHGVDRIEQMGAGAVVIGTDGKNLHFTAIRLAKATGDRFTLHARGSIAGRTAQSRILLQAGWRRHRHAWSANQHARPARL